MEQTNTQAAEIGADIGTAGGKGPQVSALVIELLCSRLCHDLVSPVGAVKSGLELIAEFDDDPGGEAMALIQTSAESASLKLRFFRVAFGQAGSTGDLSLSEGKQLADAMVASARTTLVWPGSDGAATSPRRGIVKAMLNMILVAADLLPRGGTITAKHHETDTATEIVIAADSPDARVTDELRTALSDAAVESELTPRTVQGYFTRVLLRRAGADLKLAERPGEGIDLRAIVGHSG